MGTANRQWPLGLLPAQPTPRLYDRVVEVLRTRHYSRRTEQTYEGGYDIRTVQLVATTRFLCRGLFGYPR